MSDTKEVIKEVIKDTIDIYIDYVTEQLKKLDEYTNMVNDTSINYYEVNKALANNLKIANTLNSEIQRLLGNYNRLKLQFDVWYNRLYIEQRQENNKLDLAAQKWCSAKELHALVTVNNEVEYISRMEKQNAIEMRIDFLKSLKSDWSSSMYSFGIISNNLKTEYFSNLSETNNNQPIVRQRSLPTK
jgi:hypothetical protein